MEPSASPCELGGRSRIWGLNCATGRSIWDKSCNGYTVNTDKVSCGYLQTSTAAIYDLCSSAFNPPADDDGDSNTSNDPDAPPYDSNRPEGTSTWMKGTTPETPPIVPPPYAGKTGQILLWIEK